MILRITPDVSRIALAIRHTTDWRNTRLVISPGQIDGCDCHVGGSPWYLTGCWVGKPTGVDVANPPVIDFPSIDIPAHELDDHGRIVFILPERWKTLPVGRYTGSIWRSDDRPRLPMREAVNINSESQDSYCLDLSKNAYPICVQWQTGSCLLARFDIDYGYKCSERIIDSVDLSIALSDCEEDL